MSVSAESTGAEERKAWRPGTVIGVGLSLLLFAALIGILFWLTARNTNEPQAEGKTAEQKLAELQAQDRKALSEYGWIDRPKGIVRIPIDRAISLLVEERNAEEKGKSAPTPRRAQQP
jgi:hypothetical protein